MPDERLAKLAADGSSSLSNLPEARYYRSVARLGVQAAEGLAHAHALGVLHRDVKPSNLLLDNQGTVWVTDFGLAKSEDSEDLTHTGDIIGTLRYMAPERFEGKADARSDVYALGVTLYELLTLRLPFAASDRAALIGQIARGVPPPPHQFAPLLPRDLETIVLKAMAREPTARYASSAALAEDLHRFLENRPIKARRSSAAENFRRWCRRNPVVAALAGAILLLLTATAVGGVVMSLRLRGERDRAVEAEVEGKRKLFESYVSEADATRMSHRPGQRFGSLQRVRDALEIAREVGLRDEDKLRLRNIAIAALCLPDVQTALEWPALTSDAPLPAGLDPLIRRRILARYALARLPPPVHALRGDDWFSLDGRFVAVGTLPYIEGKRSSLPVRVWRVDGRQPVLVLEDPDGPNEDATAFRPDSRQVAFGHADGTVSLYDTESGQRVRRLERGPGPTTCLSYHPRLPRLAVGNGIDVTVWDTETGQRLRRLSYPNRVTDVAWHPRGHRLATACYGREIHLWDADTGRPVTGPWQGHLNDGIRVSFEASGRRLVSNDWDGVLRLWDAATGRLLLSLPGEWMLCFGSDGPSLGPRGAGATWRVLRVAGGQELRTLRRPTPHGSESFLSFSLHPNGRLLAVVTQTGLGFFDLETGEEVGFLPGNFSRSLGASFDRTGALWTAGGAGLVRWPVRRVPGAPSRLRIGPPEWVANLLQNGWDGFAVSADGRVASVPLYSEGTLVIHRGPPRRTLRLGPQYDVRHESLSPDGRWVVTATHWDDLSGVRYKVWDAGTGRLVANFPQSEIWGFDGFSPASRWLYISGKEGRRLEVASLIRAPLQPAAVAGAPARPAGQEGWRSERMRLGGTFSPDNRLAAFGRDDGSIQLVLAEKNEEIALLPSPEVGRITPSSFSPDGTLLLARGQETGDLYVFDLRRLRTRLAKLGLDWDLPLYPSARPEDGNPVLAPPLQVELVDAEAATAAGKMADHDTRQAVVRLFSNPFDADARYRLGVRLLEAGKPREARAHLTVALTFRPDLDQAYYHRAVAAYRLRLWADAVADTSRCLEKVPFDGNARRLRTDAYRMLGRHGEAAADLTVLIQAYPQSPTLYELRASCYDALGKPGPAQADREQALKLGGTSATTFNNQAWRLVTGPVGARDPVKALALIRDAVKWEPGNTTFLNTLGVVLYRNRQYREAVATLEKSLAGGNGQSDAFDLFFLAMCHARLGDKPKAKDCFDRAERWCAGKKDLPAAHAEELKAFRAEAEALLQQKPK